VLACAFAANAQYLVTGDNDLLELKNFQDIRILSPREFELLFD
jgi:predicted nucleic acid-binding protein